MEVAQNKFKQKCPKHPDFKIEFLQVDNLDQDKKDKNLFYCSACISQDPSFKQSNYQLIQEIIKSGTDKILQRWPPLSNDQLLNQLNAIGKGNEDILSIIEYIETFFTELKNDILKEIDTCKKKMIQCAQDLPENKTQIINRYQELSKIKELRSIFLDKESDIHEKERQSRVLIEQMNSEKKSISDQITSLLNQQSQKQRIFNQKQAIEMKESILKSISNINLFESNNNSIENSKNIQDLQLIKTDFKYSQSNIEITQNENNQYQVIVKKQKDNNNVVSNQILKDNIKYVFRIEFQQMKENDNFMIGLMKDTDINSKYGYDDQLSCYLKYSKQQISKHSSNYGIDQLIKGTEFKLSNHNIVEMRVCLEDQILELLDYPHYHCKLSLQDQYKENLINQSLRLYLGIWFLNNKMILKEAFTVEKFD